MEIYGTTDSKPFKVEKNETPKNESSKKFTSAYDFLRDTYQSSDDFSSDSEESLIDESIKNYFTKTSSHEPVVLSPSRTDHDVKRLKNPKDSHEPVVLSPSRTDHDVKRLKSEESIKNFFNTAALPLESREFRIKGRAAGSSDTERNSIHFNGFVTRSSVLEKIEKESKIKEFGSKVSERKYHNYCCSYCHTKNEVNFRYGRLSECKACESKKAVYRRNLKLKGALRSDGTLDESFFDSPILVCSDCISRSKVCEICSKIQTKFNARIQEALAFKSQNYCCLSCGTNVSERFAEGCYSRCRACKNDLQAQKYRESKLRSKELKRDLLTLSPEELERLRVVKTIPSRVETLELQVSELLKSEIFLKAELEELKMENFGLRETFEDTFADLKKQIKELKFIYRK